MSKILDAGLEEHKWNTLWGPRVAVQAWMAKSSGKSTKIVHLVSNIEQLDDETVVERYIKKDNSFKMVSAPKTIETYNHLKWFIDEKRAVIARV